MSSHLPRVVLDRTGADFARAHVVVTGRVQGVFFREATRRQAERLGVVGWIRNLADGRVEAVFEGEARSVQELVHWCHLGPPNARVDRVDLTWEEPTGAHDEFVVERGRRAD